MEPALLDWDNAEVHDGALEVTLSATPTRAWASRFRAALALLDRINGDWGQVRLRRGTITVSGVRAGSESRLRHLLDSAVMQANGQPGPERPAADADGQRMRDRQMTAAFRAGGAEAAPRADG